MKPLRAIVALLPAALVFLGGSHDAGKTRGGSANAVSTPPPGKLETIERRQYPVPARDDTPDAAGAKGAGVEGGQNEVIRIDGESAGSPGLVLSRAMSGAQALGYTLIELDDRDLFFVAEKRSSLLGTVLGGAAGICKIVVGAQKDPASASVKVTLKGRSQTATGRAACERDLRQVLEYARGDVVVKPKKPSPFSRPGDVYPHGP